MALNATGQLVQITKEEYDVELEIAYATSNNFTGEPVYKAPLCYIHPEAANRLKRAIALLAPLNLKLKIWDAFRPLAAQAALFQHFPNPAYVSHPETGPRTHCRGVAIDLTIIDQYGKELEMGTMFDDFRTIAHHGNEQVSLEAQKNRFLLAGVMNIAGFDTFDTEWWHYQLPNLESFPIISAEDTPAGII
ncbi:D-alanyl-D-alanine dipeptidase [Endozoicomonas ascidiicola]|uniref:D-alanyl-D-alanine dipeptidase n=1 Tax=Endozoicomonas ascidiicola TaxID=1698521 RepID=UPI00082C352C|nr:D-alanyl-D-alanine dipeptidase [Endozoicomonas ascidiicola]